MVSRRARARVQMSLSRRGQFRHILRERSKEDLPDEEEDELLLYHDEEEELLEDEILLYYDEEDEGLLDDEDEEV